MSRLAIISALLLWPGVTLVLSELRAFSRVSLADRLRPYGHRGMTAGRRRGALGVESFRDVLAPLARDAGERLARLFGVREEVAVRLSRTHSRLSPAEFRLHQLGWSFATGCGTAALIAVLRPPAIVAAIAVPASALLAFLVIEQRLASASSSWQRSIFLELPVVMEQLAMLLSSGYSLGSALNRLAARSRGACAQDLARVTSRIRQGLSEVEALREWAAVAHVEALSRVVPVLALNSETSDLGRLISEETRAIRRDVQRELVETMERRGQQVWIPVTVATLVPGVIFLVIPFIEALKLFAGS